MKGILKIYHPEETLKYNIKSTYCKPFYSNSRHYLEVEVITDEGLDHVEDDSLQYNFPQLCLRINDFPTDSADVAGKTFKISDAGEDVFTEVDLYDDVDAYLYENELCFSEDPEGALQVVWKGSIDDFFTASGEPVPFKLKCHFRPDLIEVDD